MDSTEPTLADVKAAIEKLPREDRAILRPWILGRFDVRGNPSTAFVRSPSACGVAGAVADREEGGS